MPHDAQANSKRIAKNTILLYFRMLLLILVSLYTSRIILNALGVDDYGIYNVVGGVVTMFSILSVSLSAAISRFITFELGRSDGTAALSNVFSTSVTIMLLLSLLIILLAEPITVCFLNRHMVIPAERLAAANWVLQFSLLTFVVGLVSVPYNAAIIAHERMAAFAYISIFEAVARLLVAFALSHAPIDRLIFFAAAMGLIAIVVRLVYGWYCKRHFAECVYHFRWDAPLLRQMFAFAGWNLIGGAAPILRDQGGNVILNLFFGPSVNAARAIAVKVCSVATGFVQNFMMALNPQITKSYASGDHQYMFTLLFHGARLSFYMLLMLSLPVIFNTHYILVLWLRLVPDHTVLFVQLSLLFAMSECISNPLITAMLATGRIRNYQIIVGGLAMLNLPIAYLCLRLGCMPESVVIVAIILSQACLAARLVMLRRMIGLRVREFLSRVYLNIIVVSLAAAAVPWLLSRLLDESLPSFIVQALASLLSAAASIYCLGLNKMERLKARGYISKLKMKICKR